MKLRDDDVLAILAALKYVTSMEIKRLKGIFQKEFEQGRTLNKIWNEDYQRDILEVSKLWGYANLI